MKKILIVDDEILVRIGIKTIVSWEKYGYCVIGEAGSGNEALKKIRQECPDIILTDLVMDDGDGFQLMEICKREFPDILFVILSGYDDLEHVKKAMKLGAADYIFKLTLKPQQIIKVLDGIEFSEESKQPAIYSKKLFYQNKEAVKNNLFKKAASPQFRLTCELLKQFKQLQLAVNLGKEYGILYLGIDNYTLFEKNEAQTMEGDLLKYAIENIVQEVGEEQYYCDIFDYEKGDLVAVVQSDRERVSVEKLEELFDKINSQLERYLNVSVSGSAYEGGKGIQNLPQQIKKLQILIQERFLEGKGRFHKKYSQNIQIQPESAMAHMKNLRDALKNSDVEKVSHCLDKVYTICKTDRLTPQVCRILYFDVLSELKEDIHLKNSIHNYQDEKGYSLYDGIIKYDFLSAIQKSFQDFLKKGSLPEKGQRVKYHEEIIEVKAYVRQNLKGSLTVPIAASLVCMSDNYFSHVFKKETGISFIDFVNQERIQRAKELLITTDDKIYEISDQVGISSSNYFGILFKRLTGKSPNDYRESENFKRKS